MSAVGKIADVLQADATLAALLTGGVHEAEISRQTTPGAFNEFAELKPCATVRAETMTPWGPHERSARLYVLVWFYQQTGYAEIAAARRRVYDLLHRQRFVATDERIYDVVHTDDLLETDEPALNVSMERSRFMATVQR